MIGKPNMIHFYKRTDIFHRKYEHCIDLVSSNKLNAIDLVLIGQPFIRCWDHVVKITRIRNSRCAKTL